MVNKQDIVSLFGSLWIINDITAGVALLHNIDFKEQDIQMEIKDLPKPMYTVKVK